MVNLCGRSVVEGEAISLQSRSGSFLCLVGLLLPAAHLPEAHLPEASVICLTSASVEILPAAELSCHRGTGPADLRAVQNLIFPIGSDTGGLDTSIETGAPLFVAADAGWDRPCWVVSITVVIEKDILTIHGESHHRPLITRQPPESRSYRTTVSRRVCRNPSACIRTKYVPLGICPTSAAARCRPASARPSASVATRRPSTS